LLNSFKSPQRIALIGGTSEIGNAIVAALPQAAITEVIRISRADTKFDATRKSDREEAVRSLFSKDLDLAIIALGSLGQDPTISVEDNLLNIIEVNYLATAHLLSLIAAEMIKQGHGQILIISSFAQERPRVENFAYGSTKAAIDFYARGLADSLIDSGVEIKVLRPGFVHTKMTFGMRSAPFSISSENAGKAGAKLLQGNSEIAYAPNILKWVAWVFRKLPKKVFLRLTKD
jgi:decaprenylphospho-beta-D-erythro-pentofuranosid-2-ulose 2-reductase